MLATLDLTGMGQLSAQPSGLKLSVEEFEVNPGVQKAMRCASV